MEPVQPGPLRLHFFYRVCLGKDWPKEEIVCAKIPKRLPVVLSREEVRQFFAAIKRIKTRAMLMTIYAAGLRISELVNLKIGDIDSKRMVIRVQQGKGQKDRYVMLSSVLLGILREYWKEHKPSNWLFPGLDPIQAASSGSRVEASVKQLPDEPGCGSTFRLTRFAIRSRRICSKPAPTFEQSRHCSGIEA